MANISQHGKLQACTVGMNTAPSIWFFQAVWITLHKMQVWLLNYILHNSIVSKGIPVYPAESQQSVNSDWQIIYGPITKSFKASTSVLTAATPVILS